MSNRTSSPPWAVLSDEPVVTVVVIGWRDAPHLDACLAALAGTETAVPFEVVVTLNEPDEAVLAYLASVPSVAVVTSPVNLGFGEANNRGAALARGRYLVFLNDDTEVQPGWLDPLVAAAGDDTVGAVGSALVDVDGTLQEAGSLVWADGSTTQLTEAATAGTAGDWVRPVHYCSAASLLVRRDAFARVGGFDDGFYPAYYDDTDLCLRLRADGYDVVVQPRSRVIHRHTAAVSRRFAWYLNRRNRRTFVARWGDHLATLEQPRPAGEPSAERLTWAAMGSPQRVLAVSTEPVPPPVVHGRWCTVLVLGHRPDDVARRPGFESARVLAEPLVDHLDRPEVAYDAILVTGGDPLVRPVIDVVGARLPGVPVLRSADELPPPRRHGRPAPPRVPGSPGPARPPSTERGAELAAADAAYLRRDRDTWAAFAKEASAALDRLGIPDAEPLDVVVPDPTPGGARPRDTAAGCG